MANETFKRGRPAWTNACVGENGDPGNREYAKGYSLAANMLLDKVLAHHSQANLVDLLVYPICFNMRHSIEIRLKETIRCLLKLSEYRSKIPYFDLDTSHDIGQIWGYIKTNSVNLDPRYLTFISKVDATISDIAEVDPTGQTFRYPVSRESQKHLVDISLINLIVLKDAFSGLENALDDFEKFNELVIEEYDLGTYTRNLSRARLFDLALDLPKRELWSDISFKEAKGDLQKKYNLSSNEFSRSINKIQYHAEMGMTIGKASNLLGLSDEELKQFISFWDQLHDVNSMNSWLEPQPAKAEDYAALPTFEEMMKDRELQDKIIVESKTLQTVDKISGIHALFYLATVNDYSEGYEREFNSEKKCLIHDEGDLYEAFMHLMNKTNGFIMIVTSLFWIGKKDLAEELIGKYSLSDRHDWIVNCRDRSRFKAHPLLGYT